MAAALLTLSNACGPRAEQVEAPSARVAESSVAPRASDSEDSPAGSEPSAAPPDDVTTAQPPPLRYAYAEGDARGDAVEEVRPEDDALDAPPDPYAEELFRRPLPTPLVGAKSPAARYANLSPAQCRKELARRKLPFKRQPETKGIATALRFTDTLRGVRFITAPGNSPFGLLDCRLALTLDDLADLLSRHGVVSLRVDNFYRRMAKLPGSRKRSQHAYGLAMDLTEVTFADGHPVNVEASWGAEVGSTACGPEATFDGGPGLPLRNLICDIAAGGYFHHILTPCHDLAHRNHIHLDIQRNNRWSSLR